MQTPPPPQDPGATVPSQVAPAHDGRRRRRAQRYRLRKWLTAGPAHAWIQTGVLVLTAGWTMYTFFYKDVLIPSLQPAHLNLEATLTPVAGREADPAGTEMSLTIRASNASNRTVYPLANYWLLAGIKRLEQPARAERDPEAFRKRADQALRETSLLHAERSVEAQPGEVLAIGRLFDDTSIDPGGSRSRTILVRIPAPYSSVEIRAIVPLLSRDPIDLRFAGQRRTLEWGLADPSMQPLPMLCEPDALEAPNRNKNCRFATENTIETSLTAYDRRLSVVGFTTQVALPRPATGR